MNPTFRNESCTLLGRSWHGIGVCLLVAVAAVGVIVLGLCRSWTPFISIASMLIVPALVIAYAVWRVQVLPARESGVLTAGAGWIRMNGEDVALSADIAGAIVRSAPGQAPRVVCLDRSGRPVALIEVPSRELGEELIATARLDRAHAVASFRLRHHRLFGGWVLMSVAPAPAAFAGVGLAEALGIADGSTAYSVVVYGSMIAIALAIVGLGCASRTHLRIGPDGIWIRCFGRSRFIRYRDIEAIEPWSGNVPEGLDVVSTAGKRHRIRTYEERIASSNWQEDVIAVEVERAWRAAVERAARCAPSLSIQSTGGVDALVLELEGGLEGRSVYRTPAVQRSALWAQLEDPNAELLVRAACAITLAGSAEGDADLQRIHDASRATASSALRRVCVAAADLDPAALGAAVRALEA